MVSPFPPEDLPLARSLRGEAVRPSSWPRRARCESDPARILSDPARILSEVKALLVLFTDGVAEVDAADGRMSGAGWALDVVRAHAHVSSAETWAGLTFRAIGPAVTSGRIADIAVDPTRRSRWYVASASGGVWKTENAGTSWTPVFDDQGSYSIGCVALDPGNPCTIWVGTGENNNQRRRRVWTCISGGPESAIDKSTDGGSTWHKITSGLPAGDTGRIGLAVSPVNPDVVCAIVEAAGAPWTPGRVPVWKK